jgi:hypothetical protein
MLDNLTHGVRHFYGRSGGQSISTSAVVIIIKQQIKYLDRTASLIGSLCVGSVLHHVVPVYRLWCELDLDFGDRPFRPEIILCQIFFLEALTAFVFSGIRLIALGNTSKIYS